MKLQESSCSCAKCRASCLISPCFPTTLEVSTLIAVGYGDRLEATKFVSALSGKDYTVVAPKGVYSELTDGSPLKRCNFLTSEMLCELHSKGLKPLEGRMAHHTVGGVLSILLRSKVSEMWNTPTGEFLLSVYVKKAVNEGSDYLAQEEAIKGLKIDLERAIGGLSLLLNEDKKGGENGTTDIL